jgi:hypothetical protein
LPLTSKGEEIKKNMEKEYGSKKGEQVFYASKNKGTISGVDSDKELIGLHGGNVGGTLPQYAPKENSLHRKNGLSGLDSICKNKS